MQSCKRQSFQHFPFKLEASPEETKQGFQARTQPSPGDAYFMPDHMLLRATCFHCKPEQSMLSLGWMFYTLSFHIFWFTFSS